MTQTAVWWVLGTGPSLRRCPPDFFCDRNVIGTNGAIMEYRDVLDKWLCVDRNAPFEWISQALALGVNNCYLFGGVAEGYGIDGAQATICNGRTGGRWDRVNDGRLSTGFTVVFTAVHLALVLGAVEVVLAGVDLAPEDGRIHYYEQPGGCSDRVIAHYNQVFPRMRRSLERARRHFEDENPGEVVFRNVSNSRIEGFAPPICSRVAGLMNDMSAQLLAQ